MHPQNKENQAPCAKFNNLDRHPNWGEFHKSTQELQVIKNKINRCIDHHRLSDALPLNPKNNKLEASDFAAHRKGIDPQVLRNLRNSDNFQAFSTIEMLKKQAELLDLEDLGVRHKFSTLDHTECIPQKNILLQVTRFRKQNIRKVAKGRPQLYNWVKNHKQDIANLQYDYKTQVLKKYSKAELKENKNPVDRMETLHLMDGEKSTRNHASCQKSRKLSFVEKLKKLEELKERGQTYQKRRVHSQNQELRHQVCTLHTLL